MKFQSYIPLMLPNFPFDHFVTLTRKSSANLLAKHWGGGSLLLSSQKGLAAFLKNVLLVGN